MKNDLLTTLSVGIDVSSKSNSVCALNFRGEIVFRCDAPNNLPGAEYIAREIINHFTEDFKSVTIALESTAYYNLHLASFLSTHESLLPLNPMVYNINAKNVRNYKRSLKIKIKLILMMLSQLPIIHVLVEFIQTLGKAHNSLRCSV